MPVEILLSSQSLPRAITRYVLSTRQDGALSGFRGIWISLLSDAIVAARAVLRDLDPPEIPAGVRKVAAYSGGQLPPPLATSLLAELDRNEWLRGKAAEDWDGDPASASSLFLERPEGWWLSLAETVQGETGRQQEAEMADLRHEVDKAEAKQQAAADKIADYRKRMAAERKKAKDTAAAVRRSLEARQAAAAGEMKRARAEAHHVEQRLQQLEMEHRELQDSFDALRTRLAKSRRLRMDSPSGTETSRSVPSDPVKLARLLDLQAASFGRSPEQEDAQQLIQPPSLTLEPGVRPDSSDAVRWLLTLDRPVVILVDGYNAQFHINPEDFTSGASRRALVEALQRLRAAATAPHRVVVVYDSTLPGERIARTAQGGVEVRFAEQELIADEEIVAMAAELDEAIVISSDREVREGAEANRAVVLWSEALRDWLNRA